MSSQILREKVSLKDEVEVLGPSELLKSNMRSSSSRQEGTKLLATGSHFSFTAFSLAPPFAVVITQSIQSPKKET